MLVEKSPTTDGSQVVRRRQRNRVASVVALAVCAGFVTLLFAVQLGGTSKATDYFTITTGASNVIPGYGGSPTSKPVAAALTHEAPKATIVTPGGLATWLDMLRYHQQSRWADASGSHVSTALIGVSGTGTDAGQPPTRVTLTTVPAANAQVMATVLSQMKAVYYLADPSIKIATVELAPNPKRDLTGSRLVLGLALVGLLGLGLGIYVAWTHRSRGERVALLVGVPAVSSLVLATLLQFGLGALVGLWLVNWGVLCLSMMAIAAPVGLVGRRMGRNAALGWAAAFFLTGFPFWTTSTIWQLIDSPLARIFQVFPVPAMNTAIRQANFFGYQGFSFAVCILLVWASPALFELAQWCRAAWLKHDPSPRLFIETVKHISENPRAPTH